MGSRKEEIVMAAMELAAEHGLSNVSMSMIADRVGIKKPSLYKHFASKEELIEDMYQLLREKARESSYAKIKDHSSMFAGRTAQEILQQMVDSYISMNHQNQMMAFYRIIYSERCIQPMAARIMAEEAERMILATKQLFYAMEVHGILHFHDADLSAVSFAMTVHGLMDFELDRAAGEYKSMYDGRDLLREYIRCFCEENAVDRDKEVDVR